jgi:hypothetical protein
MWQRYDLEVLHLIYFYRKWPYEVLIFVLFLNGCASGPTSQSEQFDRAAEVSHSFDSSAAAAEYGTKR